jgi:hypothetical protein
MGVGDLVARPALPLGHLFDLSDLATFCQSRGESLARDFLKKRSKKKEKTWDGGVSP